MFATRNMHLQLGPDEAVSLWGSGESLEDVATIYISRISSVTYQRRKTTSGRCESSRRYLGILVVACTYL